VKEAEVGVVGRAWSARARASLKLRSRRGQGEDWEVGRRDWIRANAPGRSFADIGGLFKLVGDVAFLAEESGATSVTLFDVGDPDLIAEGHPEWGWFDQKKADRGSSVRYVQGNLEDPQAVVDIGPHDVVFCSGVLYHTPHPMVQLLHLREITREKLFLSTLTIPEIPGFPQACVYYPYLSAEQRAPYAAGYSWAPDLWAVGTPVDERPMYGYGNCWWGMTPSALRAMLRAARFEVVRERNLPLSPYVTEIEARPLPLDPMLPPLTYFRDRAEVRERTGERLPYDSWYDELRTRAAERASPT
jgi:hypothetical protein